MLVGSKQDVGESEFCGNYIFFIFFILQDRIKDIKARVEKIYGSGWNCYIANGRYWSVCTHRPGTNLVFVLHDVVYGIYQTPSFEEDNMSTMSIVDH